MVGTNKQRTLSKLTTVLSKNYDPSLPDDLTVLDHLLLATIQEGAGATTSHEIYKTMMSQFHGFNEIRVSHAEELAEILGHLPEASLKAKRILQILQFVFETTYDFDLEQMKKKPLKQAQKQLAKIEGTTPFIVATVVQRSLGGHSIPLDGPTLEILRDLEIADSDEPIEKVQSGLEQMISKSKGVLFSLQMSELVGESPKRQKQFLKEILPTTKPRAPKPPTTDPTPRSKGTKEKKVERKATKKK